MLTLDDVTALVVNHGTSEHVRRCLDSVRAAYPGLAVLVVDNGSADASLDYLRRAADADAHLRLIANERNVYHGPALHQGMQEAHAAGAPARLRLRRRARRVAPGVGRPVRRGVAALRRGHAGLSRLVGYGPVHRAQRYTAYVHPFAGLFDREKYFTLPPLVHHGAPLYRNMWGARRAGYVLRHVTIEDYVIHEGKVTARQVGYGLNRRLRAQARLHALEVRGWRAWSTLTRRPLQRPPLPPDRSAPPPADSA